MALIASIPVLLVIVLMIAFNVVAACATTGTMGNEGKIIKTNAVPCLIYSIIAILVLGGMILLGVDPLGLAAAAG